MRINGGNERTVVRTSPGGVFPPTVFSQVSIIGGRLIDQPSQQLRLQGAHNMMGIVRSCRHAEVLASFSPSKTSQNYSGRS